MIEIVQKLRKSRAWGDGSEHRVSVSVALEAADEIERLRAALRGLVDIATVYADGAQCDALTVARTALGDRP